MLCRTSHGINKFTADAMYSLYCVIESFFCSRDDDAVAESRFRYRCR